MSFRWIEGVALSCGLAFGTTAAAHCQASPRILHIHVRDIDGSDLPKIQFAPEGPGNPTELSDDRGRTALFLSATSAAGESVRLNLSSPKDTYIFIAPADGRVTIPRFDNQPDSTAEVELGRAGDKRILQIKQVVYAIVVQVVDLSGRPSPGAGVRRKNDPLSEVATKYQLSRTDVDDAIKAWKLNGGKDPESGGLKALYEHRNEDAVRLLEKATQIKQRQFATDSYLLGLAYFRTKRFSEAANEFDRAVNLDPENTDYLLAAAKNCVLLGRAAEAEEMRSRAVSSLGDEWHNVVDFLVDYGAFLEEMQRYDEAERAYTQAYTLGKDNYETPLYFPRFDPAIQALAGLDEQRGRYERAAELYRESFIGIASGAEGYDFTYNLRNITRVWRKENKQYSDQDVVNYLLVDVDGTFSESLTSELIAVLQKDRRTHSGHSHSK